MKRLFSILLTLCLVLSITPVTGALAETETLTPSCIDETVNIDSQISPESGSDDEIAAESSDGLTVSPLSGFVDGAIEYYTRIRLIVTDRSGNPVEGVVYGIYTIFNELIEYVTTDSTGIGLSSEIPMGTEYYVKEFSVPPGCVPNTQIKYVDFSGICTPSRLDVTVIYDIVWGRIRIIKFDDAGNLIPGVGFHVYRGEDMELVDTMYTDENGEALSALLPYGVYHIIEFDTPKGYFGDVYLIHYVDINGYYTYHLENARERGTLRVTKSDSSGKSINGALFSVYRVGEDGDELVYSFITQPGIIYYIARLILGDYYLVENSVPAPYVLDEERYEFSITYHGQEVSLGLVNYREGEVGKIIVQKTDDSGNPLSGVVFGVYRLNDIKVGEITTGEDGIAELMLPPNAYYLMELSGKPGYEMTTEKIPFEIKAPGDIVLREVVNPKTKVYGKVQVIKEDDTGNPIPGVRLGVYCHKGNLLEELVTGPDGTATSGALNAGTGYYIMELEGAPGYISDTTTRYPFDIIDNYVTVPVTITNPRITGQVKVIKTGDNGELLPGVVFGIYRDGKKNTELTTGADGTVTSGFLYYGAYELRELSTVEGYELIGTPILFSILEQGVVIEIPIANPLIYGGVSILKTDEGGAPLLGALFGLYNSQDQLISKLTTGEDGRAEISGLVMGEYCLRELTAPEGFAPVDEAIPFSITGQGQIVEKNVINSTGSGTIRVIKTGEDDEPISGVVFEVYRTSDGGKAGEITTNKNGVAEAELPLGAYYLIETQTAEGYRLPEGSFSFNLTEHGAMVKLSIQNQKEPAQPALPGQINLVKKDEDTGAFLSGAVFGIYKADNDEMIAEITTGRNGTVSYELEAGRYYLLELEAPTGYKLSADKISFTIKAGESMDVTVYNKIKDVSGPSTGSLYLVKKAEGTGARLSGAVFGVYKTSGNVKVLEITTDSDGEALCELEPGSYYLRELKAPTGYVLESVSIPFTIKANTTVRVEVTNMREQGTGSVKLIKSGPDGEAVSGAVFGVYRASDNAKIAEITTGSDGTAVCELPIGSYFLVEKTAPTGYRLSTEKYSFVITAGQTVEIHAVNQPIKGTVEVYFKHITLKHELAKAQSYTDYVGKDYIVWMRQNGIEAMPIAGYKYVKTDYPSSTTLIDGKLIVTCWYDDDDGSGGTGAGGNGSGIGGSGANGGTNGIVIPKTGEAFPYVQYALAALCIELALLFGWMLRRRRKLSFRAT